MNRDYFTLGGVEKVGCLGEDADEWMGQVGKVIRFSSHFSLRHSGGPSSGHVHHRGVTSRGGREGDFQLCVQLFSHFMTMSHRLIEW